jgi:prepilin-type N-terminal cleavage/methylation domain-containing protein
MQSKMNNKGVTLIEVMIALVVLLIVFMGLIQASLVSIDQNVRNEVRDEAVRIAAEYMTRTRATVFSDVTATGINCAAPPATWTAFPTVARNFRNMPVTYTVGRCVDVLDAENKRVGVSVTWTYKAGEPPITHTILSTLRSK